ncbi:MAG: hypothetical protein UW24_C0029G0003 [Parcubacteria group bacterium GW2011_GWA2_44_12]|nr:MAG: hypothetical protein UW24_C0029G0003 [Parcubacteria group bacterium GW2011_GWA2_44_12]
METFKIGNLAFIAGLNERFIRFHHKLGNAAAQNNLLAKKIGFGFFFEISFNDARARAADGSSVRTRDVFGFSGCVLMHRHKARNAKSFGVDFAHQMPRAFWRNHPDVNIFWRDNCFIVNVESVCKRERFARRKMRENIVFVYLRLFCIGREQDNNICFFCGICGFLYGEPGGLCFCPCFGSFAKPDDNFYTALLQV